MSSINIQYVDEGYIRVIPSSYDILEDLYEMFSFEIENKKFNKLVKDGLWDGVFHLYNKKTKQIYKGLLQKIIDYAEANSIEITIEDGVYNYHNFSEGIVEDFIQSLNISKNGKPMSSRDYQLDSVHKALCNERILILSPTGSGKSLIIYTLIRYYLKTNQKCLLIVPTVDLVNQMYNDFKEYSELNGFDVEANANMLYTGKEKRNDYNILITTWQSASKQSKEFFKDFTVIFGDEAHKFAAASLKKLMDNLPQVKYRIGTTGTLNNVKVNNLVLEGLFGMVYKATSSKEMMENHTLAKLIILALKINYDDETRKILSKAKYEDEFSWIIQNEVRNKFIAKLATKLKGNTLVLFERVEQQGIPLYEMIKDISPDKNVYYVSGKIKSNEREEIRTKAINEDNVIIVASYGTYSTGINIPSIENIIFASPTKAKIRILQSIGRGLRLFEGKTSCKLYDIADDLSWKSKENHTLRHAYARYKIYMEEGFEMKTKEINL